jgi:1-acyl-sn-glycerol-3-phosphate acyltransferase
MYRHFLRWLVRFLFNIFCRVQVCGIENVPEHGAMIIATNHFSILDPPLGFAVIERDDVTVLVAEKYQTHAMIKWVFRLVPGIFVNRGEPDLSALRTARRFLDAGGLLAVAPEGTRSHTGGLIEAKTGVAYLADKTSVPILPTAVMGTETGVKGILLFRRPHIQITFGTPFVLPPLSREHRVADLQRNTDEIMCQIAALLPPQYWGVYADYPRVMEILAEPHRPSRITRASLESDPGFSS